MSISPTISSRSSSTASIDSPKSPVKVTADTLTLLAVKEMYKGTPGIKLDSTRIEKSSQTSVKVTFAVTLVSLTDSAYAPIKISIGKSPIEAKVRDYNSASNETERSAALTSVKTMMTSEN